MTSLQEKMDRAGGALEMLRTSPIGQYVFPVAPEFSNWRDEQEAWTRSAVLLDQSHHMTDLYIEGLDTIRLFADFGINNFRTFRRNKAKQFVACNHDGHVIGDAILFGLDDFRVNLVGRPHVPNWIQYNALNWGYDVVVERDERSLDNGRGRRSYRFEVQGPNAWALLEKLNGGPIDDIRFFSMGQITIAGRRVRALKHGMAAAPGLELWGPAPEAEEVRAAILEAGRDLGLVQGGGRAYSTASTESGWFASVLPAIYNDPKLAGYREWLPAASFEGNASLGGSYVSDRIEDYYVTPWDCGYDFVDFDHEFVGRDALLARRDEPRLRKVTLVWDIEDVVAIFRSQFEEGDARCKFMEAPAAYYATFPFDAVMLNGERIGFSTYVVYSSNLRRWISLALIDERHAQTGGEVEVIWGEPDGGTRRPLVERHRQAIVRARIAPSPVEAHVREGYRPQSARPASPPRVPA
ncbi:glycine cleavage system protein T [Sphingobium jiangsuense]|uniref:Glycine cleavage system aminomethyltransferase T n=1 Tax=Sphingobium jiangsuense TaxID=870476 RepID=A0A7W6FR64_9SPHN|nr:aminomethyl transferase family protein [Sphingobium jiangsuense]MBB3927402.1 glycine cleavage system aminomethyltransferase T [Sphingobium jiangsuense]GLT02708.1 glycine cleavage system protein T [Sphingobium jiangsuense]